MTETQEFREEIERIEALVQKIDSVADPALRATTKELVQSVMDLHRAGLETILEIVSKAGDSGARIVHSLGKDDLISSLLLLYDLHPDDFETRLARGLERARKALAKRGASVDLLANSDGIVRLQIDTGGHSCGSTARDLESIVRDAMFATVPDAIEILILGVQEQQSGGFVPLTNLQLSNGSSKPAPAPDRQ